MRIGINLIPLRSGQMGGHEFYVRSLLKHLLAHDRRNQYFLFTAWWNHDSVDFPHGRYRKILAVGAQEHDDGLPDSMNWGRARSINLLILPLMRRWASRLPLDLHDWVRRLRLDLWFCPMTNLDPRQLPIPTVVTIADIQQEYYPEFFTRAELTERALTYMPSCQEATAVITVSQASKQGIIKNYGLPDEKVHCIYEAGVERQADLSSGPFVEMTRQKYQLPDTYAFYPANLWPHKNHTMLVVALHRLREMYRVSLPLVLTGDEMGQWKTLEDLARHFQLQEQIRHLGYVAAEELPSLYACAAMLVFPSLFEGFGIPLVEAMALGCPIAASNRTSIPEVVGEASLLFDPRNPDSIAEAIYRILADDALRRSLIAHGQERAALFSWEKAACETLQVFAWARAHHDTVPQAPPPRRSRIEGVYPDGWAMRKVRLKLPQLLPYLEEVEAVKLDGVSNYLTYPLTLRMKVNGRQASDVMVQGPGSFTMMGALRKSWRVPSRLTIELFANRDFIPERIEVGNDPRSLAYMIEKLSLICRGGEEVPLYKYSPLNGQDVGG
jgi:glycosyltransferase involved in cell wall biosynthesis